MTVARFGLIAGIATLVAANAAAADFEFALENFATDDISTSVIVKFTNASTRVVRVMRADCAFLDADDQAINLGSAAVYGVPPGGTLYDKASVVADDRIATAKCTFRAARD